MWSDVVEWPAKAFCLFVISFSNPSIQDSPHRDGRMGSRLTVFKIYSALLFYLKSNIFFLMRAHTHT